jgi:hypothetical protein
MERPQNTIAIRSVLALAGLTGVVGYAAFQWGGVVRSTRYECLLGLGLVVLVRGFGRAPGPGRVLGWALALLPAYVLLQTTPLPLAAVRALSPARGRMLDALGPVGAKTSFASLSVFPAGTFQQFLLVCGYVAVFLLVRELMWSFADRPWLVAAPVVAIAALEAALGVTQYFGGADFGTGRGTYANHNHFAGFLEMALPFAGALTRPGADAGCAGAGGGERQIHLSSPSSSSRSPPVVPSPSLTPGCAGIS